MGVRLKLCDPITCATVADVGFAYDNTIIDTENGEKPVVAVSSPSNAYGTIEGQAGINGTVLYTARHGGAIGNSIVVEHVVGPTGPGNEDRGLAASWFDDACLVVFGTDSSGNTIVPTAQQVVDALVDFESHDRLECSLLGDGSGLVGIASVSLSGGVGVGEVVTWEGVTCRISRKLLT